MPKRPGDKNKYVKDKYSLKITIDDRVVLQRKYNILRDMCDDVTCSYDVLKHISRGKIYKKWGHISIEKLVPRIVK